jgi:hypothetical protein
MRAMEDGDQMMDSASAESEGNAGLSSRSFAQPGVHVQIKIHL